MGVPETRDRIRTLLIRSGPLHCSEIMSTLNLTKGKTYYALRDAQFTQLRDSRWKLKNEPVLDAGADPEIR